MYYSTWAQMKASVSTSGVSNNFCLFNMMEANLVTGQMQQDCRSRSSQPAQLEGKKDSVRQCLSRHVSLFVAIGGRGRFGRVGR